MTRDQVNSIIRHVVSYGSGIASGAVFMGLTSASEGQTITTALEEIAGGLGHVLSGVLAISAIVAPLVAGFLGYRNQAPAELREKVAAQDETHVLVTSPALAKASPSPKIIGTDSVVMVPAPPT